MPKSFILTKRQKEIMAHCAFLKPHMRRYKAEEVGVKKEATSSGKTENQPNKISNSDLNRKGPEWAVKKSKVKLSLTDQLPPEIVGAEPNVNLSENRKGPEWAVKKSKDKLSLKDQPPEIVGAEPNVDPSEKATTCIQPEIIPPSNPGSEPVLFPNLNSMSDPTGIGLRTLTGSPQVPIEQEVKIIICIIDYSVPTFSIFTFWLK
jgi:hypothetical protein